MIWNDVAIIMRCVAGQRGRERAALLSQIQLQGLPKPILCEGTAKEGSRSNWKRFLRLTSALNNEWILHVEDDACLAPDFAFRAIALLSRGVANVLTFYSDRKRVLEAFQAGKDLTRLTYSDFCGTVCFAMPTCFATPLLDYLPQWEQMNPQHAAAEDYHLRDFCRRERLLIQASVPSLAQHRPGPSLQRHPPGRYRYSRTYLAAYGEIVPC